MMEICLRSKVAVVQIPYLHTSYEMESDRQTKHMQDLQSRVGVQRKHDQHHTSHRQTPHTQSH